MNHDEHDDLWELLGKAKDPQPSPFFSRNVLREVRNLQQEKSRFFAWLRQHWVLAGSAACAVVVSAISVVDSRQPVEVKDPIVALAQQVATSPDFQVIENLDELIAFEDNSVWLDSSPVF